MKTILALLAILLCCSRVQAQNVEGQIIASQFGSYLVPGLQTGSLQFEPATCQVSGGGKNFAAFTTGVPVKIIDSNPALNEIDTPVAVFINSCAISMSTSHIHSTPFYATSGTGGLQEAILNGITKGGGPNTIILNADWYTQVAPGNPATVVASVQGNASTGLIDVTTTPYTFYSWNGSQYLQVAFAGGFIPATTNVLCGTGSAGSSAGCAALPNGTTATTQGSGDNSTKVATTAFVLQNAGVNPGGSDTQVQVNLAGIFGADPTFTFNTSTKTLGFQNGFASPTGTATNSTSFNSGSMGWQGSYWTGSAAALDGYQCLDIVTATTANPFTVLNCSHSGSSGGNLIQFTPQTQFTGGMNSFSSNAQLFMTNVQPTFFPETAINYLNGTFYPDGFTNNGTGYFAGIGQATIAFNSSVDAKVCQSVSSGGNFYIALATPNKTTTPGTNLNIWWPVPQTGATKPLDCAWYMAESFKHTQHASPMVAMGDGAYQTNGLVDLVDGNSFDDQFAVSLTGVGIGGSVVSYTGAAAIPVISRPTGGGNFASMNFHDMTIDGGGVASAVMELDTMNQSQIFNISGGHIAPGTTNHAFQFAHTGGFGFQTDVHDINVGVFPDQNWPNCSVVTPTVVAGSVTAWTVNTAGSCYQQPSARNVYHVQLRTRNGAAADGGCTTYPSGQTVTLTGAGSNVGISSITGGTGGTGCGAGPFYVQVYSSTPVAYGMILNQSDSHISHLTSYLGDTAAFLLGSGNMSADHLHPSVVAGGIQLNGSGALDETEIDDVFDKAITVNTIFSTTGWSVSGTHGFVGCGGTSRLNVGSTFYYFQTNPANVSISSSASLFDSGGNNSSCNAGWAPFLGQSGAILTAADLLTKLPTGATISQNDPSNTVTAAIGDYSKILTVGTLNVNSISSQTIVSPPTGVATSGANFASSQHFGPQASYWNGSAAATSSGLNWLSPGGGTNPTMQEIWAMFPCPSTCTNLFQQPVLVQGLIAGYHLGSNVPSGPTIAAGTGAGTSPTVAMVSFASDLSGYFTVTTGTGPTASAVVATMTFNQAYNSPGPKCEAWPDNAATAALTGVAQANIFSADITTTTAALRAGSTALAASTAYRWGYTCTN